MTTERSAGARNALLAVALVGVVAACGAAGMYFSKEVSHAATTSTAASPAVDPSPKPREAPAPAQPAYGPSTPSEPAKPASAAAPITDEVEGVSADASASTPSAGGNSTDESPGQITDDKEVNLALERWRKAMLTNDSGEIAPSYAPHVNRFFLRTQVDRAFIRDYLERDEETGKRLTRYDMEDVAMKHLKPDEVEVDFRANFAVSTPEKDRTGGAKTTLILKRLEGDWKIVYERDFKS